MNFFELLILSLSLAVDCFAVSCVIGALQPRLDKKYIYRFALAFGIFQGGMPFFGWALGGLMIDKIERFAPIIAFAILAFIGGKMILESIRNKSEESKYLDVTTLGNVLLLAIATSIDALAVGFGFAMINENILRATLVIGLTSFIVSLISYYLSKKIVSDKIGRYAELIGGVVLILIGLKILLL